MNLAGRMEYFPSHPGVVFDVAHNPDKAAHLVASLQHAFEGRRFTFVLAIGQSKDAQEILRALAVLPATFIFTSFETEGRRGNAAAAACRHRGRAGYVGTRDRRSDRGAGESLAATPQPTT